MNTIYFVIIMLWLCAIWIRINTVKFDIEEIKIRCEHLSKMQELLCNHVVKNTDILTELIDDMMEIEQNNEHNN